MDTAVPLTLRDVADLLFAGRERIDFYWNFYVIVVIAVIGWMVTIKKTLTTPIKVLVSVAFLIATATNLVGLYSAYTLAEALRTDLLRLGATSPLTDTRLVLEQHSYASHRTVALAVQLVIGAAVLFTIWFGRLIPPELRPADDGSQERGAS
jgi:hypothetical protein